MKKTFLTAIMTIILSVSVTDVLAATKYTAPKELDQYLYEMTYTDYDYAEYKSAITNGLKIPKIGCSGVHNGNYFGRNFDFFYNDFPQYVIHVPKANNRYASMGLAYCFDFKLEKDMTDKDWRVLPWTMLDGMNEKGVGISINVCPIKDLEYYIPDEGTNPGKEEIDIAVVVRYLLDHAKSAKHGLELLQNVNIVDSFTKNPNFANRGFGLHLMICDCKNNYVVEIVNGKLQYVKDSVMTNFFNTLLPKYTPHATGVERYAVLKENYEIGAKSMDGMKELMRKATFSYAYNPEYKPVRYSDFFTGYSPTLKTDITLDMVAADEKYHTMAMNYLKNLKIERNNSAIWITTSTSVYDLKHKKWSLFIQENYDKCYEYTL